ncbi:MAG: hypothetical protein BWZ02_00724 [Lentisphaerae bacterium ADurb.BinA184]|nr:MAG: hypothetical protein BWZ02_00724 [Lentisphaerae bacterium ADurb.BinA184]
MSPLSGPLPVRGFLLHITHYDPVWCARKATERPFDLKVALAVIDAMAEAGLNLLIVDAKDAVAYATHPELARPYTQPMQILHRLREHAFARGIETAVKLNFSQSALHQHNHWFRPYHDLFDNAEYWQRGFQVIDELVAAVRPKRFFHIGMDEDHARSYTQYAAAIQTLHGGLAARSLRTLIWNDSACAWPAADIHKEKSLYAEERIPRDVIQVVWDYAGADRAVLERIRGRGFEVWGAPGSDVPMVVAMRDALVACGGGGLVLTRWIPCVAENRERLVSRVREWATAAAEPCRG